MLLHRKRPLQVVGVINAYAARLAAADGFQSPLSLREAASRPVPAVFPISALRPCEDVLIDVRRVTDITDLPCAGRRRHRLGRRTEYRQDRQVHDQSRRSGRAY